MNVSELLSKRIYTPEIKRIASWASGSQSNLSMLWSLAQSEDRIMSVNALWTMTHLCAPDAQWLMSIRNEMIDMLLTETDTAKKRMLLNILRKQECRAEDIRTDFLDYCMSKINSECEPYAIRCFSLYAAFKMCRHFPELIAELEEHLDMMQHQILSPGLKSAHRQVKLKITRQKKLNTER